MKKAYAKPTLAKAALLPMVAATTTVK